MDPTRSERRVEWFRAWMTGPARLQIESRKREAAELCSALSASSDVSFDAQTLVDLIDILNHEFLCHKLSAVKESSPDTSLFDADDFPIALSKEWATGLLAILSSCLVKSISPTAYRERELQCRALISTTALLLAQKVEALQNDFHNGFHRSLSSRFEDLQWQPGPTGDLTHAKFCKVQCSYLLAATQEYSSRFRRAQPLFLTVSSRIMSLLSFGFSAASPAFGGGGFNLQAALNQLGDSLQDISRRPDSQYEAMFNLQELSMLVSALDIYQNVLRQLPEKSELADAALTCAKNIGTETIEAAKAIILENSNYENNVTPPPEFWQKYVLAPLHRGPPSFNSFYYLYGLVDCATQIGKTLDKSVLAQELDNRLRQVALEGTEPTHRWKALEYLISVQPDYALLERDLLKRIAPVEKKRLQHELEHILTAVRREVASYPLPSTSSSSGEKKRRRTIIPANSCLEKPVSHSVTANIDTSCNSYSIRSAPEFPKKDLLSAGFSPDCKAVFLQASDKAVVISLPSTGFNQELSVLAKHQTKGGELWEAVLSDKYLATISDTELRVTAYRHTSNQSGDLVGLEPLGKNLDSTTWSPYSVAIHDARRRTWIAVGGETTSKGRSYGIIEIFEIYGSGTMGVLRRHNNAFTQASRDALKECSIRSVTFSPNGSRLICITNDHRVLVWLLSNNMRPRNAPFVIHPKFAEGIGITGLTSASIFRGPSSKSYILGTTWPSSLEGHRHGSEWSFVSPIASTPAEVPKEIFHELKDLGDTPIIAGAASPRGEVIALWDDSGQIRVVTLDAAEEGGLRSSNMVKLDQKKKALWRLPRTSPSSIRFKQTEKGLELLVLSRGGNVLQKVLDDTEIKQELRSPRASMVSGLPVGDDDTSSLRLRASHSDTSRSEDTSAVNIQRLRLETEAAARQDSDNEQSDLALLNETLRKTTALSFTEEASVTAALVLTRSDCPNEGLWRRTLTRRITNPTEQIPTDYFAAFQTYLKTCEELEREMDEYVQFKDVFHVHDAADTIRVSRPPRAPSMDGHSNSVREIYEWLWYLQDVHARSMAGIQLLHDERLLEGFLNILVVSDSDTGIAKVLPVSLELLEVMTECMLKGLDILGPHLEDSREMGLMEMLDALFPLKRVLDRVSSRFGLFAKGPNDDDDDIENGLPAAEELERFRLLTEMILLCVLSYPGSHATDFPARHLEGVCKEFHMSTKEWAVSFRQRSIGCLQDFVKGPMWVFNFEKSSPKHSGLAGTVDIDSQQLYLSTSLADFADLFGRVSPIHPKKGDPLVTEIDWPGGTLRALSVPSENNSSSTGNEVLCFTMPWSDVGRTEAKCVPFDSRKRLLLHPARG